MTRPAYDSGWFDLPKVKPLALVEDAAEITAVYSGGRRMAHAPIAGGGVTFWRMPEIVAVQRRGRWVPRRAKRKTKPART